MQNYIVSHYLLCGSNVWTVAKKTCSSEKTLKNQPLQKKKSQHILLSVGNQVEEENVNHRRVI